MLFLKDNLLEFIFRKGVVCVYQCNNLFFEVLSNLFSSEMYCKVIWSISLIVCSNDIGTKLYQNLGDFNVSSVSSTMKSSPEIKFISLVLLFVTIFKVANDSYHPLLALASKLAPCSAKNLMTPMFSL